MDGVELLSIVDSVCAPILETPMELFVLDVLLRVDILNVEVGTGKNAVE